MVSKALRTRATPHIPASAAPVSREQLEAGAANFIIGSQRSLLWRCVMPLEPQAAPTAGKAVRQTPGQNLCSLNGCLVEGDPEQRARERSVRRRALIMSIAVQGAALAVLILIPLFGRPERIAVASVVPLPPYQKIAPSRVTHSTTAPRPRILRDNTLYQPRAIPTNIATSDPTPPENIEDRQSTGTGLNIPDALPGFETRNGPEPQAPVETRRDTPRVIHLTHVDPAMLIHHVDPVYPALARQIGRAGRVELRALIATDGTIQSLQVVSGDPLFYHSALDAVRQWRYSPTVLNGQPVEVNTFITVIYNMQR
jgi:periplasmic protein TonB